MTVDLIRDGTWFKRNEEQIKIQRQHLGNSVKAVVLVRQRSLTASRCVYKWFLVGIKFVTFWHLFSALFQNCWFNRISTTFRKLHRNFLFKYCFVISIFRTFHQPPPPPHKNNPPTYNNCRVNCLPFCYHFMPFYQMVSANIGKKRLWKNSKHKNPMFAYNHYTSVHSLF